MWEKRLHEILEATRENTRLLREILRLVKTHPNRYSLDVTQEIQMAVGNIAAGATGQLGVALLDNGSPYVLPEGSAYVLTPTFTADDATVTFAAATTDASNGTIPLDAQTVISVPAGDPGTSVTITASAPAPDGTTATGTLTITLTPVPQVFTLAVSQLA